MEYRVASVVCPAGRPHEPRPLSPGAVSYPPGAEFLSHAEVAERITDEIGTAVQYVPVSREQWQADLESSAPASGGVINPAMAQHISSIGAKYAEPDATPTAPRTRKYWPRRSA